MSSIVEQFENAASTYGQNSDVQKRVAVDLVEWLSCNSVSPESIFEIGCGTGHLTRALADRFESARILATDASSQMVETAKSLTDYKSVSCQRWTAEQDELNDTEEWDLIVSSMAFQWLEDPLGMANQLTRHAGRIAMSIPIEGSFDNWIRAHQESGLAAGIRPLMRRDAITHWLSALPNDLSGRLKVEDYLIAFEHPIEFVRSLKAIGGGSPRSNHVPVNLKRIFKRFPDGIEIRYAVAFISIERSS